jgi:hypothetical protein
MSQPPTPPVQPIVPHNMRRPLGLKAILTSVAAVDTWPGMNGAGSFVSFAIALILKQTAVSAAMMMECPAFARTRPAPI